MSEQTRLTNPTNFVVGAFDDDAQAQAARDEFRQMGINDEDIRMFSGKGDAGQTDVFANWFADTNEEITKYLKYLRAGGCVVLVPAGFQDDLESLREVFHKHNALRITHFGTWVTEATA